MFNHERVMSINHWRFRLLHWGTGCNKNTLPSFLYTNYCPLFHFTNFLVLIFPLICFLKLFIGIFKVSILTFTNLVDKITSKAKLSEEERNKYFLEIELDIIKKCVFAGMTDIRDMRYHGVFKMIDEEIQEEIDRLLHIYLQKKEKRDKLKKKINYWVILLSNMTSFVFRWGFKILALIFICCLLYIIWNYSIPGFKMIYDYMLYVFKNISIFQILKIIGQALGIFIIFLGTLLIPVFFEKKVKTVLDYIIAKPTSIIFYSVTTFISTVYANNCPPIKLIEESNNE